MGRGVFHTPELLEKLAELCRQGATIDMLAARAGVSRGTIIRWLREARGFREYGIPKTDHYGRRSRAKWMLEFLRVYEENMLAYKLEMLERVNRASERDAAWAWRQLQRLDSGFRDPLVATAVTDGGAEIRIVLSWPRAGADEPIPADSADVVDTVGGLETTEGGAVSDEVELLE